MNEKMPVAFFLALSLILIASPLFAHHSQGSYDIDHEVTITGTVTEFEFVNPHSKIHLQAKDASGNIVEWMAEGAPPNGLRRQGWTSTTIKPGDQVIISGHVAKSGRKEMHIVKVEVNGKIIRNQEELYK